MLDGPQSVSLSATAVKHSEGRATLHEVDDEGAAITLDVSETSFKEDGGADVSIGTVTRNTETFSPLVVQLQFDDPSEASAPPSVLIPAGESSANFVIAAVDDLLIDGEQVVRLTASADFFASDQKSLFVSDVESWQNPFRPGDVNADGNLSAFDALLIVNELGRRQFSDPDSTRLSPRILEDSPFFDTNGDNHATAIDVLLIINRLTRVTAGDGEEVVHSDHETNHAATDSTALQWDKPKSLNLHPRDLDHAIEVLARDQNRLDVRDLQRDELCRPAPTLF